MTYRRSSDERPGSSRWRRKHREFLLRCGLPNTIVGSDKALIYVLLHGSDEFGTGWDPSWVSREQAEALLRFLRQEFESPAGYDLIAALERRLASLGPDR